MVNNVINVSFGAQNKATTRPVWLIDKGMVLKFNGLNLPTAYEVDFSNSETAPAIQMIGDEDGVSIPNSLFTSGTKILAWLRLQPSENVGYTVYQVTIPLQQRPANTGVAPTPQEATIVEQAIAALNAAVEQTGQDVIAAQAAQAAAELAQGKAEDAQERAEAAQEKAEAAQEAAEDAQEAAETAEEHAQGYAEAASGSATAAAQCESNAEAWATGQRGGADVPSTDTTYENNAKYYAGLAEQSAGQAGYMFFYIDQNGHLIYQHTPNILVDFYLFNGHLYVRS